MTATTNPIKAYLSAIGRKGGQISRRHLSAGDARDMVRVREARKAFRTFHAQCFWYMRPDLKVTLEDVPVIVLVPPSSGWLAQGSSPSCR